MTVTNLTPEDQDVAEQNRREAEATAEQDYRDLVEAQGWTPVRQADVAEGYIRETNQFVAFNEWATKVAADENDARDEQALTGTPLAAAELEGVVVDSL